MTQAIVEVTGALIVAPGGRQLFEGLTVRLSRERVALVGRNGVGKSMLLTVLAGEADPERAECDERHPEHLGEAKDDRSRPEHGDTAAERRGRAARK